MTVVLEDEVKVTLPEGVALPSFAVDGLVADARPPVTLTATYWDTADRRLLAHGITVRRRTKERATTWDVKVPRQRGSIGVRHEVSYADRAATPPARVTDLLVAWTGGDPLEQVATLRTRRVTWTIRDGSGNECAEVVDDEVALLSGRTVLDRFREVEVERRGVGTAYVRQVVKRLEKAGGTRAATTKVGRFVTVPAPAKVRAPRRRGTVTTLVAAGLAAATTDLLLHDVGARLRAEDAVHQLRVACRKMRSLLRGFGDVLDPAWRESVEGELRWLGGALAAARDAEVMAERLAAAAADLGAVAEALLADVTAHRARTEDQVVEVLGSARYLGLARLLRTEAAAPPLAAVQPKQDAETVADRVVTRALDALDRAVRKARRPDAPDAAWHKVRIAAKRARYAVEASAPVVDARTRRRAKTPTAVQDVLGDFHDTTNTVALLTTLAADRPDDGTYAYVAGRLVERELAAGRKARAAFDRVWRKR